MGREGITCKGLGLGKCWGWREQQRTENDLPLGVGDTED